MLLIYMGLIILVYMQFGAGGDLRKNKNLCIWIGFFLFIVSAMKAISTGADLANYASIFNTLRGFTYRQIWNFWIDGELKDGVFYIVAKVFGDIGFSAEVWMGAVALVVGIGVAWFIYRNSAKPFLSLMMFMTLEYYRFTLTGLRQAVAMAIILMVSYNYMIERRLFRFTLSVLIAALFHSSALLFLPAYFVVTWKIGIKQLFLMGAVFMIYFVFPGVFRWLVSKLTWSETFSTYANSTKALTWSGFIIHLCILAFCLLFRNETRLNEQQQWMRVDAFINCMVIGLCIQMFSTVIAEAFRMAYYYNMCCIVAVPNVVTENKREQNHSTMYILLALCLAAYMLWSRAYFDFKFFWQI